MTAMKNWSEVQKQGEGAILLDKLHQHHHEDHNNICSSDQVWAFPGSASGEVV